MYVYASLSTDDIYHSFVVVVAFCFEPKKTTL